MKTGSTKVYRFTSLLLVLLLSLCVMSACGGESGAAEHVTHLSADAKTIADTVRAGADFSLAQFTDSSDENSLFTLMFDYGIEDDAQNEALLDYALSTLTGKESPAYFACVRVKDGTDPALIEAIGKAMTEGYAQTVINDMHAYGTGDSVTRAENYTLHTYDNGLILTVYDTNGNEAILSLVDSACK